MTPSTFNSAVSATGLRKSFGDKVVLDGIGVTVDEGTIFALLGPNGAGKTTMVRIMSTLIPADSGQVCVAGHDVLAEPDAVREAIGVTGQFSAVDELMTGEENLGLMADLNHLPRSEGRARTTRAARALRPDGRGAKARVDLLGRDAPPAGSGHDARRIPQGDIPRRANHRVGPAQPPHHVGQHSRSRRERGHRLSHDAVPRRGR